MMEKKYQLVAWTKDITDKENARLDILTGNFDHAIRFLLQAADYCIWEDSFNWAYYDTDLGSYSHFCGELRHEFVWYCEEAIALARKHDLEHVLQEKRPKRTMELYQEHTQEERDLERHLQEMSAWH